MKLTPFLFTLLPCLAVGMTASAYTIQSPSGLTKVVTSTDAQGQPRYTVYHAGKAVIENAPLGLVTDFADLSKGLSEKDTTSRSEKFSYTQDKIKKSNIDVDATRARVKYENADGNKLTMEWHVADNDVAYRYFVPAQKDKRAMVVKEEKSGYSFPQGTKVYMTPQSKPMIGWKRTKPSYEEYYIVDAPLGTPSEYGEGFTFPALFESPDGVWALLTETGVNGYYCASHLTDFKDGAYRIAYPMEGENNGNGTTAPGVALPGGTPWRTITLGESLAPIMETTIPYDLVDPMYETSKKARTGKGTWSWILWQDKSINLEDQKKFIDLAAELGFQNVLIDNWWDKNIGGRGMEELISYGKSKNVKPILWFSSSGYWNDIEQSPVNLMDRPIIRKKTMKWMQDMGVDMIKVDFFGGDKQETMRLYEDILSDAADHDIDVIFHGCTLPRGWERMYPNYVGSEAVLASENMIFGQDFCDKEALHATLHPFIRNSAGIMEYGGSFLNRYMNKGNKDGIMRKTSDAFEMAVAVMFQNPVQNFALAPNNLTDAPKAALDFLKTVPVEWDDVKYIDGKPGKYVVMARRSGDKWYVAGVSNEEKTLDLTLDLSMIQPKTVVTQITDGGSDTAVETKVNVKNPSKFKIRLRPESGFVVVGQAAE